MVGAQKMARERALDAEVADAAAAKTAPGQKAKGGKRRLMAGAVGLGLSTGLVVFAGLMNSNASFAAGNVTRQLKEQDITFKAAADLTDEERAHPCLVHFAGRPLTTGAQAECYANDFIGVHLKSVAGGARYSSMRATQDGLRAQITDAQKRGDTASLADLNKQLGEVTGKRQALFEGETLRGLLMTSYGFDMLGAKARQASTAASTGAAGIAILSVGLLFSGVAARRAKTVRVGAATAVTAPAPAAS